MRGRREARVDMRGRREAHTHFPEVQREGGAVPVLFQHHEVMELGHVVDSVLDETQFQ